MCFIGRQQCVDGIDEDNCGNLEYNECENDEYRCRNRVCIDAQYLLDSDYDCPDWSDEQIDSVLHDINACPVKLSLNCDEGFFSSADGEIITEYSRFNKQSFDRNCKNYRDRNFMCELYSSHPTWTSKNGHCLEKEDEINEDEDMCIFYLKCTLTKSEKHISCNCERHDCIENMKHFCKERRNNVFYPISYILAPLIYTLHDIGCQLF
ncbi:unnamed protein product [Didymodactylos carnosus]|uniref:Uncharacterized protein n=1 Tax=Didymodactylos carnosus TaxID=1234261 RepID=A0A816BBG2_9BILA|nr:unnamed protein product [Didymodactylos carnosus]CAF1608107.1 unnamed protein product [Didymodactylos carnosus]CAF4401464.1 unnamed protein product [Didymodactylos carnosus]CAF4489207.1 unnamed protein product [Didymodactylos carnosus]